MNFYILAFLSRFLHHLFSRIVTRNKSDKTGAGNIAFKSTGGGQAWQHIIEGLSGKLEEGGFSLYRKIRISGFLSAKPGADTKYFCCTNFKRIRKIKGKP